MATDRARQGGGKETPLVDPTVTEAGAPGQLADGSQQGSSGGIQRGTGADWFGPLNPMEPTAPPDVAGRRLDLPSGYNLTQQPRAYNAISFPQLRYMADGYDLLRTIIETRKDEMARMNWSIAPRDPKMTITPELKGKMNTLEKFFLRPDKRNSWGVWLRMVLEDLLVIDAPSIYLRRTRGGDLYSLEVIDGATIKIVVDDWGRTPEWPIVAYQQALKGFPAINYTTRDLYYSPRNQRASAVYGYSPVEQILMTVSIGMRREVYQLNYFTEGNMPEALIGVPETWTPDQIRAFQDWFDGMLQGNLAERRRAKFVPAAVGKNVVQTKDYELFGKAEEWLARVCCFAFSISPQPFVEMMNRATAETAQESAATNGLIPLMNWVKDMVNTILVNEFNETDLEFRWVEEDEIDPKVESEIVINLVAGGILTINQGLTRLGEDTRPEPEFDRPMLKTATGYVPVALTPEEKAAKEAAAAAIAGQVGPDGKPVAPKLGPDGKPLPAPGKVGSVPGVDADLEGPAADAVSGPASNSSEGNAQPDDESEIKKRHDAAIKEVERVAGVRSPHGDDAKVSWNPTAKADVVEAVLNAAALKEPNWR